MSLAGFYGSYQVQTESGTELSHDSEVVIEEQSDNGTVPVTFMIPDIGGAMTTKTYDASYDDTVDSLRIDFNQTRVMFISRFVDPAPGSTFQAIYGIVITPSVEDPPRRMSVWSAKLTSEEGGDTDRSSSANVLPQAEFAGGYTVRTTADTQFGLASPLTIVQQTNGFLRLQIINALGNSIMTTTLTYDESSVSVHGSASGSVNGPDGVELIPATVGISLARDGERKYIYGIFTVGDPRQAGTFGGEEEAP